MTGIQALQRAHETLPTKPGRVELQEFEYIRHGTQSLIANWHVALGKVIAPQLVQPVQKLTSPYILLRPLTPTRKRDGYSSLTSSISISLSMRVRLVANCCELDIDLGIKGKSGILESMTTRAADLADPTHRIRFVYIPKHTSWLNQIECWFSIFGATVAQTSQFYLSPKFTR